MNLDATQTARVQGWIEEGLKLSDIQTRMAEEMGIKLTYMEARMLLDDLKLRPKDPPPPPPPAIPAATGPMAGGPGSLGLGKGTGMPGGLPSLVPEGAPPAGGRVKVEVDTLARPGSLVSGKVTFHAGQKAEWQMDQMGRLAVAPRTPGFKPSPAEVAEFQAELDAALAQLGF
jgi:hypothetical protein